MINKENTQQKKPKTKKQSKAEIKLELREYVDTHIKNLRKELREDFERNVKNYRDVLASKIRNYGKLALLIVTIIGFGTFIVAYNRAVSEISNQISIRLDREFESEKIGVLVEEKAKDYTEKRVQKYISEKVNETITPFAEELNRFIEIIDLEDAARYGFLSAYKKLHKISSEKSNLQSMAERKIIILLNELSIYRQPPVIYQGLSYERENGSVTSAGDLTTKKLFSELENLGLLDQQRHTLMVYIMQKPKNEILSEALRILTNSNSLPAVAATCGILAKIFGEKAPFMDIEEWIKVCKKELTKKK